MAATKMDIDRWFEEGLKQGATHMIVAFDGFSNEDYPVYVKPGESARHEADKIEQNMRRVMEVYSLKMDKHLQLSEFRAFHYD